MLVWAEVLFVSIILMSARRKGFREGMLRLGNNGNVIGGDSDDKITEMLSRVYG
jgi:hypothetical protein